MKNNYILWIEGCNGSGKSFTANLLRKEAKNQNINIHYFHCPKSSEESFINYPDQLLTIHEYLKAFNNIQKQINAIKTNNNFIIIDRVPFISGIVYQAFYILDKTFPETFHTINLKILNLLQNEFLKNIHPNQIIFCNPGIKTITKNRKNFNDIELYAERYEMIMAKLPEIYNSLQAYYFNYKKDSFDKLKDFIFNSELPKNIQF